MFHLIKKMTRYLDFICFIILIYRVYCGTKWSQAYRACGSHGLENDESILRTVNITDGQEFWIGIAVYSILTQWIEEIGCFQRSTIDINTHASSFGHCSILCQTENYFGYMHTQQSANCICLPNGMDTLERTDLCECDRKSLNQTFTVFKKFSGEVLMSSQPGNCATLCCGNCLLVKAQKKKWEGRDCLTTDDTIIGRCGGNYSNNASKGPIFRYGLNYKESRQICVSNNQLLASSTFCDKNNFDGVTAWTNVVRERIEVNLPGTNKGTRVYCLAATFQTTNGKRKLVKYRVKCSQRLEQYICKSRTEKETTSLSIQSTSAFLTELSTSVTDKEAFDNQPEIDDKKEKKEDWINQNGTLIGGIVSGVAILIVLMILVVCKLRGPFKSRDPIKKQSVIFSNKFEEGKTTKTLLNQAHSYDKFQMVNINGRAVTGVIDINKIYTDSPNGEYDMLNDLQRRKIRLQENVYDSNATMLNQDDHLYDQSVFRKLPHGGDGDVNDYSLATRQNSGDYDYALNYNAGKRNANDIYD